MPEKKEPAHAKEKLSEPGKHFLDNQDLPVPSSTLSSIFKEKEKYLKDIAGKKKKVQSTTPMYTQASGYIHIHSMLYLLRDVQRTLYLYDISF